MNFKTTIVLFVALLVVGIIFVASNKNPNQSTPETVQPTAGQGQKLIDMQSAQVKGITITDADGNRTSVRQDGPAWKMTDPVASAAVDWQTQDMIRTICDLRSQGRPDSAPSDPDWINPDIPSISSTPMAKPPVCSSATKPISAMSCTPRSMAAMSI